MHTRKTSFYKAVSWRVIGVGLLAFISFMVTQSVEKMTLITFLHHMIFINIYYYHERIWNTKSIPSKKIFKALTYEIVLGFLVLGSITMVVTGSWKQMTDITLLYLGLRLIGYPIHEWFYERRKPKKIEFEAKLVGPLLTEGKCK